MDASDFDDVLKAVRSFVRDEVVRAEDETEATDATPPQRAEQLDLRPLVRIISSGLAGVEPVAATELALTRTGLSHTQIDLIELNEALLHRRSR